MPFRLAAHGYVRAEGPSSPPQEVAAVPAVVIDKDDQHVLNHCTRFLARDADDRRHDFGQYAPDDPRAKVCEAWRYPIVDSYYDGESAERSYAFNAVTFVHDGRQAPAGEVATASRRSTAGTRPAGRASSRRARPSSSPAARSRACACCSSPAPPTRAGSARASTPVRRFGLAETQAARGWSAAGDWRGPFLDKGHPSGDRESFMAVDYMDLHILDPACGIGLHRHRDNQKIFFHARRRRDHGHRRLGRLRAARALLRGAPARARALRDAQRRNLRGLMNPADVPASLFMFGGCD